MTILAWEPAALPHQIGGVHVPGPPGDEIAKACRLHEQALIQRARGRFAEAGPLAERALEIFERECGPDHPDVANVLLCLAGIREETGDLAAAESLGRRAADILEGMERTDDGGSDVPRLRVQVLGALAGALRNQGRYGEAEPLLRRALALCERDLGADDLQTAALLNDLGMLHKYQGRYDEAELLYRRALDVVDAAVGPDDLEAASLYHNLGGLEHARGRAALGEPLARWGLKIRERGLGSDHPHVAADKAALAAILDAQGRYAEAEELYGQALAVFERVYGPEHYEIAVNLNNLAAIHQARGEHADAERLYLRSLAIKEKVLGADHPDLALTLHNLAALFADLGRPAAARPLYRRALSIFERALGREHPHFLVCRECYEHVLDPARDLLTVGTAGPVPFRHVEIPLCSPETGKPADCRHDRRGPGRGGAPCLPVEVS